MLCYVMLCSKHRTKEKQFQLFPRLGPTQTLQDVVISGSDILGDAFSGNFYRSGALKFQDKLQEKLTEEKEPIAKLKGKFWARLILLSFYLSSRLPH